MAAIWNKARHWEFLAPWFERLEGRLASTGRSDDDHSHPIRCGIEQQDWYIDVMYHDVLHDAGRLQEIGEALLLVGAFAQLNRDCCMQYLKTYSLFEPAAYVDLDNPEYFPRFSIDMFHSKFLEDLQHQPIADEAVVIPALLSGEVSDAFKRMWAMVLDMLDRVGRAPIELKPVEVHLIGDTTDEAAVDVARKIEIVRSRVCALHSAACAQASLPRADVAQLSPILAVTSIDLELFGQDWNVAALIELRRLVETGVHVFRVSLPKEIKLEFSDRAAESEWWCAWRELLRSLTGQPSNASAACGGVRKFCGFSDIPNVRLRDSILSALVIARDVSEVVVVVSEDAAVQERGDHHLSQWIACLLFQDSPSNDGIQSITFEGGSLQSRDVEVIKHVQTAEVSPLASLCHAYIGDASFQSDAGLQSRSILLPSGTVVLVHDSEGNSHEIALQAQTQAIGIYRTEDRRAMILVPGLGLCSVDECLVASKRSRTSDEEPERIVGRITGVRNIALDSATHHSSRMAQALVEAIGDSLEGLALTPSEVTTESMWKILAHCPNLRYLRVYYFMDMPLQWIYLMYEHGMRVSSLDLAGIKAESLTQFQEFLGRLHSTAPDQRMYRSLQRLSLRHFRYQQETLDAIDAMLASNHVLTHLHLQYCHHTHREKYWTAERHHGQGLPILLLDRMTRLAFLSVAHHLQESDNPLALDDNIKQHILDFASTRQRRSVVYIE